MLDLMSRLKLRWKSCSKLPLATALALPVLVTGCGDNISPAGKTLDISGLVWNDTNGNGLRDADEQAIANAVVFIDDDDDRVLDADEVQTRTDAQGVFRFDNLPAGTYLVRQDLGFGWRASRGTGTPLVHGDGGGASLAQGQLRQGQLKRGQLSQGQLGQGEPGHPVRHIIGGSDAPSMAYPFMASIGARGSSFFPFCGGALISDRFVLTAAHCSEGEEPEDVSVMLATSDPLSEGRSVEVKAISIHPEWEGDTETGHDMALWELAERLDLAAEGLGTVDMLTPADQLLARSGSLATTIGWGVSDNESPLLQEVNVPIVSEDQCAAAYPSVGDFGTQICAGSTRGGLDSCQGDSGGPLLVRDTANQRWLHAGITSWGEGCALPGKPGIYGRTSAMSDWAKSQITESSASYQVTLSRRDVELEFPNESTLRPTQEAIDARWSTSAVTLDGVVNGAIAADTGFRVQFFLFADPDFQDQFFDCALDVDGPGVLEGDGFSCKAGVNSIRVSGYPDGIHLPTLQVESGGRTQARQQILRVGTPSSTEQSGALTISDETDADYAGADFYIDYFSVDETEPGKAVVIEMESSFGGQLAIYDADVRDTSGGGTLQVDAGGLTNSLLLIPQAGRSYLIGVSSIGQQATGTYTLRLVNSGTATATTL